MVSPAQDLLWAMLPEGLQEYFDVESYEKTDTHFRITLIEKNEVPEILPEEYQRKKIINTTLKPITIDSFPIRGRVTTLTLKRRRWTFEGVEELYMRPLDIRTEGTKLENEFAEFVKKINRV
jgi:hypothetical protein